MRYRVDLLLRAKVDEEARREILMLSNTNAIAETVEATLDNGDDECRFTARIDGPNPEAALGSVLTVLAETSGHVGLREEGSIHRVVIDANDRGANEAAARGAS